MTSHAIVDVETALCYIVIDGLDATAVHDLWRAALCGGPPTDPKLEPRLARLNALRDRVGRQSAMARNVRAGHTPFAA